MTAAFGAETLEGDAVENGGGPGRTRTSNQTVMSGGTRTAGVDFPEDWARSIVFVASRCEGFWCETGAVIAACLREAFDCVMVMRTGCGRRPQMQLARRSDDAAPVGWAARNDGSGARFEHFRYDS